MFTDNLPFLAFTYDSKSVPITSPPASQPAIQTPTLISAITPSPSVFTGSDRLRHASLLPHTQVFRSGVAVTTFHTENKRSSFSILQHSCFLSREMASVLSIPLVSPVSPLTRESLIPPSKVRPPRAGTQADVCLSRQAQSWVCPCGTHALCVWGTRKSTEATVLKPTAWMCLCCSGRAELVFVSKGPTWEPNECE